MLLKACVSSTGVVAGTFQGEPIWAGAGGCAASEVGGTNGFASHERKESDTCGCGTVKAAFRVAHETGDSATFEPPKYGPC